MTVIIAVLVVLYFDERVRNAMTLPQRGRAIGWLGGILALGIFMPVMTLAGFVPVREQVQVFMDAANRVLSLTVKLAGFGDPLDDEARGQLAGSAPAEFAAAGAAEKAISAALHPEDGNGAHSPARARQSRAVANGPGPLARPARRRRPAPAWTKPRQRGSGHTGTGEARNPRPSGLTGVNRAR